MKAAALILLLPAVASACAADTFCVGAPDAEK